ncbi:MAG: hypothetical protein ABSC01_13115 [Verrucomicrobiota bacterium]
MPPLFLGRTLEVTMSAGFDAVSRAAQLYAVKGKELVADFRANEKFVENSAKLFVKV